MERYKADKYATMITSNLNRFVNHYDTRGKTMPPSCQNRFSTCMSL